MAPESHSISILKQINKYFIYSRTNTVAIESPGSVEYHELEALKNAPKWNWVCQNVIGENYLN